MDYPMPATATKVNESLERLASTTSLLEQLVVRLNIELSDVLTPEYDHSEKMMQPQEAPVNRLHAEVQRLNDAVHSLTQTADRIRL